MKKKSESLVLGEMLQKIAPKIGAKVLLEPEWRIVGQITFKSGRRTYFRYNTLDLNPVGASDVAKDKDYANFFMVKLGYPVVPGSKTFFRDDWCKAIHARRRGIDEAYAHAQKLGLPVIVKPNSGSQGTDVALVHTKRAFYRAVRAVFKNDRIVLVQNPVFGKDYRIVVLDGDVISAYERIPLSVVGDGKRTVRELLLRKQRSFSRMGRDTQIVLDDPRIKEKLARDGCTFESVVAKGRKVFLLDNANLSSGGEAVDVTSVVHPTYRALAVSLTRDMGLRLCGVDLMICGDITEESKQYWVLEINAAPGLDHYSRNGIDQQKIVEQLYSKVLKSLDV
ncbi:MAG: cyanophycin synthetase [Candidatus Pacebacteria bacterium]|nr:cyanophycin synthetase [Candidatus Paceibacterota bacterium]MCF7857082.1 cyanophycin synthetase [Candidatus Paceibacterota bacterium]